MNARKSDEEIEKDVKEKLMFEPQLDESKVHVSMEDGVVTLLGTVCSYLEKRIAERAVKECRGRSWLEIQEAKRAAWAVPGVVQIEDHLTLL